MTTHDCPNHTTPMRTAGPGQRIALVAAVAAATPYAVLKMMWLAGSTLGMTSAPGSTEMSGTRFVAGNTVTVMLMVVAVAFLAALTRPWAHRVPAGVVFVLGAGATGLLAPILLGLPLGLLIQAVTSGDIRPDEDGLAPWVFGVVYTGFGVLATCMVVIVLSHVQQRWGHLLTVPPHPPARWVSVAGAAGLLPFAATMAYWGMLGPADTGPQGMDQPAQRTVLLVTAALAFAAFATPHLTRLTRRRPRLAWFLAWTGCCVAALQGPTHLLLAQGGNATVATSVVAALATPGACLYGLGLLGRIRRTDPPRSDRPAAGSSR